MIKLVKNALISFCLVVLLNGCSSTGFTAIESTDSFVMANKFAKLIYKRAQQGNIFSQQAIKNCKESIRKNSFNFVFFEDLSPTEQKICLNTQLAYMNTGDFTRYVKTKKDQIKYAKAYQLAIKDIAQAYDLKL
ncbi:MAG TPA: hypothetical protein DCL21_04015 [Alphaproteobacteria bacterium]|nr:hypothetical protein [Alphaproteobacteria bacterium]